MKNSFNAVEAEKGRKRRATIFALYTQKGLSIAELAGFYDISYERARQIIRKAEKEAPLLHTSDTQA